MFSLTEVPPQSEKELWLASLTEVPPQSEEELWLASLTEVPLNPKKNFGSLRSPKLFLLRSNLLYHDNRLLSRKRTLARFAHRSPPQSEEELWLASLTEVISSSEQPPSPSDDLRVLAWLQQQLNRLNRHEFVLTLSCQVLGEPFHDHGSVV